MVRALEAARPRRAASWPLAVRLVLGMVPGTLYVIFNPDGIPHPDRWSYGPWLQALKYTPLPHLASFVFGMVLAELDELIAAPAGLRLFSAWPASSASSSFSAGLLVPYPIVHDGLLMPLFGCIILGLSGDNLLALR